MSAITAIIAAAGSSRRFQHPVDKKPFINLGSKAVWLHSAELLLKRPDVQQLIVVIAKEDQEDFMARFGPNIVVHDIEVVLGGAERIDSIANALEKVDASSDLVLLHDAARPCIDNEMVDAVVAAAMKTGAAIPAIPVSSTLKKSSDGKTVDMTVDRSHLYQAQTPQIFRRELIQNAFANRADEGNPPTDEAQLLEQQGTPVSIVPGSPLNIKLTHRSDLNFAKACLNAMPKPKPGIFG